MEPPSGSVNHQKNFKEKYYLEYGTIKYTFTNLNLLKHNIFAISVKLKDQKKRYNRKLINQKFSNNPKAVYRDIKDNSISKEKLPKKEV